MAQDEKPVGTEKKSVLKRFEFKKDFTNKMGKANYVFTVEFENGDLGEYVSSLRTPNWNTGTEYSYIVEQGQYGLKMKSMKSPEQQEAAARSGNGSYRKYDSPDTQKGVSRASSMHNAIDFVTISIEKEYFEPTDITEDQVTAIAEKFYAWLWPHDLSTEKAIAKRSALSAAINQMKFDFKLTSTSHIIERAEKWVKFLG